MKEFKHIIYIPFRGVGVDLKDEDWFLERIKLFGEYTLASLTNQSNKDFTVWMSFRPQDKGSAGVTLLEWMLRDSKIEHVFTFDGLMYWDDKFNGTLTQTLRNIGRVIRTCFRAGDWENMLPCLAHLWINKNATLTDRLESSLWKLDAKLESCNWILLTRLDSDDMLHKDFVAEVQRTWQPRRMAMVARNGYVYNGEWLAEWKPATNPPFHTIVFSEPNFFDPIAHRRYYGNFRSHEDIPSVFPATMRLSDGLYCVNAINPGVHISTNWDHPFRQQMVSMLRLKDFGV